MPEVVKRPSKPNTFVQVSVAVISGMAAMYCVQNFKGMSQLEKAMVPRDLPGLEGAPKPKLIEPVPAYAPGARESAPPRVPVQDSMMIKPEPGLGGEDPGVLAAGWDDPEKPQAPAAKKKAAAVEAPPAPKPVPKIGLKDARFSGRHQTTSFGSSFRHPELSAKTYEKPKPKEQAPPPDEAEEPAAKPVPKTKVRVLSDTPIQESQVVRPPEFDPQAIPPTPFWTTERRYKVGVSGLIAIVGAAYFLYASGVLATFGARRPGEEE